MKPKNAWWIHVAAVESIIAGEVNYAFRSGQGLTTLVGEQQKILNKLKSNLQIMVGVHRLEDNGSNQEDCYVDSGWIVKKEDAVAFIKDCGLFYQNLFEHQLTPVDQDEVWRDIAKFVVSIIKGLDGIEQQHESSSGHKLPPVLPSELVKVRSHEFNGIISQQGTRYQSFYSYRDLENIQAEHKELLSSHRNEKALKDSISDGKHLTSFEDGWECVGARFGKLKEFCGGLATVFPGTATVESDFSVLNWEKNDHRVNLTDLSLEGIFHAKQFDMIQSFFSRSWWL